MDIERFPNIMDITKDVKRFSNIIYNIGYLTSQVGNNDDGWADDLACMISDYITDLFIAKRGEDDE